MEREYAHIQKLIDLEGNTLINYQIVRKVIKRQTKGAYCVIKLRTMAASALSASMVDSSWESLSLRSSTSLCSFLMWLHVSCKTFEADT